MLFLPCKHSPNRRVPAPLERKCDDSTTENSAWSLYVKNGIFLTQGVGKEGEKPAPSACQD